MSNRLAESTRRLADGLFGSGYRFFLPYLAVYALAWAIDLPIATLRDVFALMHVLTLALLVVFVIGRRHEFRRSEILFWLLIFAALWAPGAYFEYPSDTWEHFRRIQGFLQVETIDEHGHARWKFAYFWMHSFLYHVPLAGRREGLDFFSAFWQLLVAVQVHAVARRLGADRAWAKIHVLAFFLVFGQGISGMRYYGISSTPLAYVAFLHSLVCWMDILDGRNRRAWRDLPALLLLAFANHRQEVMFIGLGSVALVGVAWFQHLSSGGRRRAVRVGLVVAAACFAAGAAAWAWRPELYDAAYHWQITRVGSFRLWQRWYFIDTWGIHGLVGLAFAVVLFPAQPRLGSLTLLPIAALLLPPSALVLSRALGDFGGAQVAHRVLLGFPTSFALVQGLRALCGGTLWDAHRTEQYRRAWAGTALGVLLLTLPPWYPWNGRAFLQFHRPHPDLELVYLDETFAWFSANREIGPHCQILSDPVTQFALHAHLGSSEKISQIDRVRPWRRSPPIRSLDDLLLRIETQPICAVLVAVHEKTRPVRRSVASRYYRAWDDRHASPRWLTRPAFREAAEGLVRLGWTRTPVPPGYLLYEPPGDPNAPALHELDALTEPVRSDPRSFYDAFPDD